MPAGKPGAGGRSLHRPRLSLKKRSTQDMIFYGVLLLPAIVLCVLFIIVPIVDSVIMSFTTYRIDNLTSNTPGEWNNFANYTRLWNAGKLQSAAGITVTYVVITVALTFLISMTLALMLNSKIAGARFLRSIMMIPWVIPTVIAGLLWAWIYANPYGLLQYFVSVFTGGDVANYSILSGQTPPCGASSSPRCGSRFP